MRVPEGRLGDRGIIIPVFISPNDPTEAGSPFNARMETGQAVIDTGAMRTAVTRRMASRLALRSRGKLPVQTPAGTSIRDLHTFRLGFALAQGESPAVSPYFLDEAVEGMNWEDHPYLDVLIGMDVIRQCDLHIRSNGMWTLTLP
jgi:hypothetical protein